MLRLPTTQAHQLMGLGLFSEALASLFLLYQEKTVEKKYTPLGIE